VEKFLVQLVAEHGQMETVSHVTHFSCASRAVLAEAVFPHQEYTYCHVLWPPALLSRSIASLPCHDTELFLWLYNTQGNALKPDFVPKCITP